MPRTWLRLLDPKILELRQLSGDSAAAALRYGRALNLRCLHDEAREVLDRGLAQARCDGDLRFERIMSEGDHGTGEALDLLHRELLALRHECPTDAAVQRNLGFVLVLLDRPEEAAAALRKAFSLDGHDSRTLELLGLVSIRQDAAQEARAWLLKALSIAPRDPRTLRLLGIACEDMGDLKGAEAQYMAALEAEPEYYWGWHSLGELLLKRGETEEGLRCVHKARSIQPREAASFFILAELFAEQGHLELAQGELHQLVLTAQEAPVRAEAYALLGELRQDMGDTDGATSYFTLAAETDAASPDPWAALGDLARAEGRWDEALRCYEEASSRDPEAADLKVQLGYALLHQNRVEEAEALFLSALEADPGEYSAYLGLSECYRQLQRPEDQLAMVRQAMDLAPEDADVWNAQGVALELAGRPKEATGAYEKALALAPAHRKAANNLGFLLEKRMQSGEPDLHDRAVEAWKRRLLICRDEGQSLKMAMEHLVRLGAEEEQIRRWLEHDPGPES